MLESLTNVVSVQTNCLSLFEQGLVVGSLGVLADSLYLPCLNAERVQPGYIYNIYFILNMLVQTQQQMPRQNNKHVR